MPDEKKVTVDLKRTYAKDGKHYGPGQGVEMPESLAKGLGLLPAQQPKPKAAKASK